MLLALSASSCHSMASAAGSPEVVPFILMRKPGLGGFSVGGLWMYVDLGYPDTRVLLCMCLGLVTVYLSPAATSSGSELRFRFSVCSAPVGPWFEEMRRCSVSLWSVLWTTPRFSH